MNTRIRTATARTCAALSLFIGTGAFANNIQVSNVSFTNGSGGNATIQFDLSWENSWKGGGVSNHDAAWVFMKYQTPAGIWSHIYLSPTGYVAGPGCQLIIGKITDYLAHDPITNPVVGVFMERTGEGNGTFTVIGNQLVWNYATQGLAFNDISKIQVFAIEMVHVPQGAFSLGDGSIGSGSFTDGTWTSGPSTPLAITSENPIDVAQSTGNLWATNSANGTVITPGTLSAAFPKGFNAFYCMKYEVTQQGYVDFLNTLTYTQQQARTVNQPNSAPGTSAFFSTDRNGISIRTPGVYSTTPAVYACNLNGNTVFDEADDGKDIACNYLVWSSLSAYLDWSGLRPWTELEFEKACRGPLTPVSSEYPWGGATLTNDPFTLENDGSNNEGIASGFSTIMGNAHWSTPNLTINGPMRVGIFAANSNNTGRMSAGASYYGIMELAGNCYEYLVVISVAEGQAYEGTHGDGRLTFDGQSNGVTWPGPASNFGAATRGGSWSGSYYELCVSNRERTGSYFMLGQGPSPSTGGRGVRTAP